MRPTKLINWLLCCGMALLFVAAAPAQQKSPARVAGHIVAAKVTGTVTATNQEDKTSRELKTNDILYQHHVVNTAANSSVILVFSNGATLNIGAESTLSIDEYLQDPLEKEISLADLKEEPNSSVTKLNLSRGELVGNVKHLREDRGSSFTVNTPVGAAGIRGTTFRIVFRPDATGKVFFTLSTAEGVVLLEGATSATSSVNVETGKEVVVNVEVNVDTATGKVTVTSPPQVQATQDIPAATQTAITAAAQQITDVSKTLIISTTQQASADAAAAKAAADAAAAKAAADKAAADAAAAKEAADKAAADEKAAADKKAADAAAEAQRRLDDAAAAKAEADKAEAKASEARTKTEADARQALLDLAAQVVAPVNTGTNKTTNGDGG
jgi:hypothetical protein